MKKYILSIFAILVSLAGFTQTFSGGLMLGVSGNQIDGDEQGGYKKPGLIAGAYVKANFTEFAALKIETYYIGKGAVMNTDLGGGAVYQEFKTDLHYIEMPFLFNMTVHPKIEIALGIAPSYLFKYKIVRDYSPAPDQSNSLKDFDFQPMGQVDFFLTDRISSCLRFSYSMLNISKNPTTGWLNNNIAVVLRYKIK